MDLLQTAHITTMSYQVSTCHVSCPPPRLCSYPNCSPNCNPNGQFEYNIISTYYDTINASYSTINFNLGLSRVLSLWVNFIRTGRVITVKITDLP